MSRRHVQAHHAGSSRACGRYDASQGARATMSATSTHCRLSTSSTLAPASTGGRHLSEDPNPGHHFVRVHDRSRIRQVRRGASSQPSNSWHDVCTGKQQAVRTEGGFGRVASRPGYPLESAGRWRSRPITAPIPRASSRCAPCALRLPPPSAVAALRAGARPLGLRQRAVRYGPGTVSSLAALPAGRTTSRPSAPARSRSALPSSAAKRLAPLGGCVKRLPTVKSYRATRALCANPAGGGVLRCAAARGGSARQRRRGDRGSGPTSAKARAGAGQAPIGPCARTIAPNAPPSSTNPRVAPLRARDPTGPSHRGSAPSVQPIRRST